MEKKRALEREGEAKACCRRERKVVATLAKIEANQGNAKRSTGPRMCSRDKTESSYRSPHGHPLRSLPRHRAVEDTQAIHVSSSSPARQNGGQAPVQGPSHRRQGLQLAADWLGTIG